MTLLALYLLFLKVSILTFGGGFAMIPLYQDELVTRQALMTPSEFADVVALAQMTPGPVGLNAATYVGQLQAGMPGAFAATLGVMTPSVIIGLLVAFFLQSFQQNRHWQALLRGLRPATLGLLGCAVLFFAGTSIFHVPSVTHGETADWPCGICWQGVAIFAGAFFVQRRWKPGSVWLLLGGAVAGWLLFLFPVG